MVTFDALKTAISGLMSKINTKADKAYVDTAKNDLVNLVEETNISIAEIDASIDEIDTSITAIDTSITEINTTLDTKVDKVSGKQLSTNDYTTTEKNKLAGIAAGATKIQYVYEAATGRQRFNYSGNTASANYTHAEGYGTHASAAQAHAEGLNSTASGVASHAECELNTASGQSSHAEGYNTTASGFGAHTEGFANTASGNYSHAEGYYNTAGSDYQHVQGQYGVTDTNNKYAHIVGNGSSSARSNAHTLDWNGLGWFAGGLKVGGTGQDDTAAVEVATKTDVEAVSTLVGDTAVSEQINAAVVGIEHPSKWLVENAYSWSSTDVVQVGGISYEDEIQNFHGSFEILIDGTLKHSGTTQLHYYGENEQLCYSTITFGVGGGEAGSGTIELLLQEWLGGNEQYNFVFYRSDGNVIPDNEIFGFWRVGPYFFYRGGENFTNELICSFAGERDPIKEHLMLIDQYHRWARIVIGDELSNKVSAFQFEDEMANKVDKVDGMGLSTNDYTTEEKEYLASLEALVGETSVADQINTAIATKMDKENPTGTGSFSLNRKAGTTIGAYSHAEGYNTTASNNYAHAEGGDTIASGYSSHAEGNVTVASGGYSHAEGDHTQSINSSDHAEGHYSVASGAYSHAEGNYTIAASQSQHVQGKYNISDNKGTYAHIVGNGDDSARSNAHTLDWDGNAWFQGTIKVGGSSQDDEAAVEVATKNDISAPKDYIVLIDQVSGLQYRITMRDGSLTSELVSDS